MESLPNKSENKGNVVNLKFAWLHPNNGCSQQGDIITEIISATGSTLTEAFCHANFFAENSPHICGGCRQNYIFLGNVSDPSIQQ